MTNLPSYIKPRDPNAVSLAQRGLQNVGTGAGPYVSLNGDRFTLIDAAGGKQSIQTLYFDCVIIDINEHLSKMFYLNDYNPDAVSPPLCWSDNGIGPSTQAREPQALTCQMCPNNKWASKISNMGSEVKACRDEQKVAVIVPGLPNSLFRLTIPPNSLKNWQAYLLKFASSSFGLEDVVTRLEIIPEGKKLQFNPAPSPWLDAATLQVRDRALAAKAADIIVGRLDRPRQASLPAPTIPVEQASPPLSAPSAVFPSTTTAPAPTQTVHPATAASPSEQPQKRRRRTAAEIAADNAKQAPASPPAMAPFRPEPNGATPPPQQGSFGIQAGTAPNPDLVEALKIFDT